MKKIIATVLCFALSFVLIGCTAQNEDAKTVLTKVLNKEQSFSYTCMVGGETAEETLEKFSFNLPYQAHYAFVPQSYVFTDRDSDGTEELLVLDMRLFCILVLDYDGGKVTGTILDNINLDDYRSLDWIMME